jgi:uncharacterized protein (TIGR03437 family)
MARPASLIPAVVGRILLFSAALGHPTMVAAPAYEALFAKQPLRFEENRGQLKPGVPYFARGPNYVLALSPSGNTLTMGGGNSNRSVTIQTRFLGAKRGGARIEALEPLSTRTNYFVGSNSRDWRAGVRNYGKIREVNLYSGIDLVFYGNSGNLEYDFVVKAGAKPGAINLEISGADKLLLDANGDLLLRTQAADVRWKHPVVYQATAEGKRDEVDGRFVILGGRRVGFRIGKYDKNRDLIIDPVLSYATYLGSSGNEGGRAVVADPSGNIYIAGYTSSNGLQVTPKAFQTVFGGATLDDFTGDGFIAKFTSAGSIAWLTFLGGSADDGVTGIALDRTGNIYVTGFTSSSNFPTTSGVIQPNYGGSGGNYCTFRLGDAFVTKLDPSGSKLIYSTYLGGNQDDGVASIAVDELGNAYVAGATLSPNFPTTSGVFQKAFAGSGGEPGKPICNGSPYIDFGDAFVAKLNATATQLIFSTYLGGSQDDMATAIAVDSSHNVYVAGATISGNFPITAGAFQGTFGGVDSQNEFYNYGDGFIAKLNSTGSQLMYSTYLGGQGDDEIFSLTIDSQGDAYVTGSTSSPNFPVTAQAIQSRYAGYDTLPFNTEQLYGDAFVTELNPSGTSLLYSTFLGGSKNDFGFAIAVGPSGLIYVAGATDSPPSFPVTPDAVQQSFGGDGGQEPYLEFGDGFLTIIDVNSTKLVYSTLLGGSMDDEFLGMAFDPNGNLWIVGNTMSPNFPVTASTAAQATFGGFQPNGGLKGDVTLVEFSNLPAGSGTSINSVVNGASFQPGIVPGSWATIKGSNLSSTQGTWNVVNGVLPTQVNGVSVTVGGQAAYVYFVNSDQLNFLVPNVATGPQQVIVQNSAGTSPPATATVSTYGPAFFLWPNNQAVATRQDFTLAVANGTFPGTTTRPAKPGDTIILWGTGFGPTNPAAPAGQEVPSSATYSTTTLPTVVINNIPATVYGAALAPGFAGLYQVAIQVPTSLANGNWPVVATIGGVSSPSGVVLTVQQ